MVQCSLDGFRVLSLNFGGKWKKLAETRSPETPTFRMYGYNIYINIPHHTWKSNPIHSSNSIHLHIARCTFAYDGLFLLQIPPGWQGHITISLCQNMYQQEHRSCNRNILWTITVLFHEWQHHPWWPFMILYPLSTHHGGQRWASPSYLIFSTSLLKIEEAHTGEKAPCQIQIQIQIQTLLQIQIQIQIQVHNK